MSLFGGVESPPPDPLKTITDLDELAAYVRNCRRCPLRDGCNGVVFGEGGAGAQIMCIGEGPGADEDKLGRPFVGRAGQLLDRILAACRFNRFEHVYIANIVKCRPPQNRTPTEEERAACRPNLDAQIRVLNPKIIVLLGATAVKELIDPDARITRLRGEWIERAGVWYMPTYHPAALLRNPNLKPDAWKDFQKVVAKYRELVDPSHPLPEGA